MYIDQANEALISSLSYLPYNKFGHVTSSQNLFKAKYRTGHKSTHTYPHTHTHITLNYKCYNIQSKEEFGHISEDVESLFVQTIFVATPQ